MFQKYRNPDQRCCYPFSNDFVGYCWSFATHADGDPEFTDIESICANCSMWKDSPNFSKEDGE